MLVVIREFVGKLASLSDFKTKFGQIPWGLTKNRVEVSADSATKQFITINYARQDMKSTY
jgi:hypothetical protein